MFTVSYHAFSHTCEDSSLLVAGIGIGQDIRRPACQSVRIRIYIEYFVIQGNLELDIPRIPGPWEPTTSHICLAMRPKNQENQRSRIPTAA